MLNQILNVEKLQLKQDIVIPFCSNVSTLKVKTSKHKRNQSLDLYKVIQSVIQLDRGSYGKQSL